MREFYWCKLQMSKIDTDMYGNLNQMIRLFTKGKIYKAIDSDSDCCLFKADNGDLMIIESVKLKKHFRRTNIMPEIKK